MRKRAPRTLVVQIPCYNEAGTLPAVLASIPHRPAAGVRVLTLVVDDGSTDGTAAVARRAGADFVVRHTRNRGLAAAFRTGLATALRLGADVVVNTDGDNQYPQAEIPRLVGPILDGTADIVVADRQTGRVAHFSPLKKLLQAVGSAVVRAASGTGVRDAPSGFRAYSREAALRLYVHSYYSYTLETLIQAGAQRLRVVSVPVTVNPQARTSRLMSSLPSYLLHSAAAILRAYATYRPLAVFSLVGALFLLVGTAGILRFLYYVATEGGAGHVQSVMLAATLWAVGVMIVLNGLQADLTAANRRLAEEALYELRRQGGVSPARRGRRRRSQAAETLADGRAPAAASSTATPKQPEGRAWRRSVGRLHGTAEQPAPRPPGSWSRPRTRQ
jgi:glycosyltransferase involved in cell wall biosynthesis